MPLIKPTPRGQLAGDLLNFLGALNQHRNKINAHGITGERAMHGDTSRAAGWAWADGLTWIGRRFTYPFT